MKLTGFDCHASDVHSEVFLVKISDRNILSDFPGFPQYVQENAMIVPQIKPDLFVTRFIILYLSTRNDGQFNISYVPVSGHCGSILDFTALSFVNRTNLVPNFLNIFIAFLNMFRANMCPSSGENTVPMRHLVFVTLYR